MKSTKTTSTEIIEMLDGSWTKAIFEITTANVDKVPDGWMTCEKFAICQRCSTSTARRMLRRGIEAGAIEEKPFRIKTGARVIPVPHYRPIP